jgi:hypothetical protein
MKLGLVIAGVFLAGGTLGLLAATPWQDAKAKEKPQGGDASMPFTPEEMAAWQKAMTPGPEHEAMARLAGTWTVTGKMWMKPDLPPTESTGTSTFRSAMGGRYLIEEFSGSSPMGKFNGMGILAYDNTSASWQHVWFDDMSTALMVSEGKTRDGVTTLQGEFACPIKEGMVKMRMVMKPVSDNERIFEMWATNPGEKEYQSMVLTYKRDGAAKPASR